MANIFKDFLGRLSNKTVNKQNIRPGLTPPVVSYSKKGSTKNQFYLDITGEKDYDKNTRLKRVTPLK